MWPPYYVLANEMSAEVMCGASEKALFCYWLEAEKPLGTMKRHAKAGESAYYMEPPLMAMGCEQALDCLFPEFFCKREK